MDVTPFDLRRMFLGDLPPLFLLEIVFRTAFLFCYTLFMIRIVGKRGVSQITPFELTIIIALGSAVGDPMFYPDVPLLHGMVVITTIVLLQRNLIYIIHRSQRAETFVEGEPAQMVLNGRLELECMDHERFSRDELFSSLRLERVEHLGQVKCAYLEDSGQLSTFLFTPRETRPGLPIIPLGNWRSQNRLQQDQSRHSRQYTPVILAGIQSQWNTARRCPLVPIVKVRRGYWRWAKVARNKRMLKIGMIIRHAAIAPFLDSQSGVIYATPGILIRYSRKLNRPGCGFQ